MTAIDIQVDVSKKLQSIINSLKSNLQEEVRYTQFLEIKYTNARELLFMLSPAESLADRVEAAGDLEAAENAYNRILNAYRTLHTKHWHEIRGLLLKLATMFWRSSEPLRTEALLWEALELPSGPARNSDLELLKLLARSLRKTCDDLSRVLQSMVIQPIPAFPPSPFPPLHRMLESKYALKAQGNIFQMGPFMSEKGYSSTEDFVPGGLDAVLELLGEFSDSDLEMRDIHGRTPLYLASTLRMEALGCGLLVRASEVDEMAWKMANARDLSGQTVLGISIKSRCSLEFIRTLIDNGAEVDPALMPIPFNPLSPLQLASSLGANDIVALLLSRGADPNRVYPESKTAKMLAQEAGHFEIVELFNNPSFTKSNSYVMGPVDDISYESHELEWFLQSHLDDQLPSKLYYVVDPRSSITTPFEIV